MNDLDAFKRYDELKTKEEGYDAVVAKFGSIENALKATAEEDILKFYYCESRDKYLVGQRLDNMYYAEITRMDDLAFIMSRYLPWEQHVIAPYTAWKEHTYPSKPKEMYFPEWLKGLMAQQGWRWKE